MINRQQLLADLQKFLQRIEADLLERSESTEVPEVPAALHAEYKKAAKAERTAQNYEDWRTDTITQAAAAWVLSCVFVRFLEDNSLIDPPKIAGPGDRLGRARDEHELYFRSHPQHTDREYLLSIFAELAKLPGTKDIFGEHNAINDLPNWLSGDAAGELLNFFQKIDASTGELVHDFTDPNWDTRFLGDLYQDLSEAARKKFALLQTPDFVEEFILDHTLELAMDEFGLTPETPPQLKNLPPVIRMIDPACGSGHFLLGSFHRILDRWLQKEPGTNIRELVQRALNSIHGVDVNPFAVAIARFRLVLAAIRICNTKRLYDAPGFEINLACGDSLYHGRQKQLFLDGIQTDESHYFYTEDADALKRILREGTFHVVVANPPYIIPRDQAANAVYRRLYKSCHRTYSLSVPFMERIFSLCIRKGPETHSAGFCGQITANSFMKADFGKNLTHDFFKTVDLNLIVDSSGALIPGHSTPTVMLFGRNQEQVGSSVRVVMGICGDPETPPVPRDGPVWASIQNNWNNTGFQNAFITVVDFPVTTFYIHPWNIGGGGQAELKRRIDESTKSVLGDLVELIGVLGMTNADEVFVAPSEVFKRHAAENFYIRQFVNGDQVRHWSVRDDESVFFPYENKSLKQIAQLPRLHKFLWTNRTKLGNRATFSKGTYFSEGRPWWEWHQISLDRLDDPRTIVFAFVATHNHFALSDNKSVFNRPAPIIKPRREMPDEDLFGLLGLLNSSIACFWIKQVAQIKTQTTGMDSEAWRLRRQLNSTIFKEFPVVKELPSLRSRLLHDLGVSRMHPLKAIGNHEITSASQLTSHLAKVRTANESATRMMISIQEELDWECYKLYGLLDIELTRDSSTVEIRFGERAFEIVLARRVAAGELSTTWFERHGSVPITQVPEHWPEDYKRLVNDRIEMIEQNVDVSLVEQPECKRRWDEDAWDLQVGKALKSWLLDRLESYFDFDGRMNHSAQPTAKLDISLTSLGKLADFARNDTQFMVVGEVYRENPAFDVLRLIEDLVDEESVPLLPILRYKPEGMRVRLEWEKTWARQRDVDRMSEQLANLHRELATVETDSIRDELTSKIIEQTEARDSLVVSIPVPPKYKSSDFVSGAQSSFWNLRGSLDVPKERWVSFPQCEGPDGTLVICWAGYDHLQQAQAISAYYVRVQTEFGGSDDPRLIPLLASLIELLPWLKQWHNEPNANFDGLRMGDYFEGFINEEARNLGKTLAEIKAWTPPVRTATRNRKKAK